MRKALTVSPDTENGAGDLQELVMLVQRYLYLPDPAPLYVAMATVLSNRIGGKVWSMLVGPASCGGTEIIMSLDTYPHARFVERFSEPGLLSGVSQKDKEKGATGGLLMEMQTGSTLVVKDFTGVLTGLGREEQGKVFAALRDIYDGSYSRAVGAGGGKTLTWKGGLGVLTKSTPAIDTYAPVIAAMGDRFVYWRYPVTDYSIASRVALGNSSATWRAEIAAGVEAVLVEAEEKWQVMVQKGKEITLSGEDLNRIVAMAEMIAEVRVPIKRDMKNWEIQEVGTAEGPARSALALRSLWKAMTLLGIGKKAVWKVLREIAEGTIPGDRGMCLRVMGDQWRMVHGKSGRVEVTVRDVEEYMTIDGKPRVDRGQQLRRGFEELVALGVVKHKAGAVAVTGGQGGRPRDSWEPSEWLVERWVRMGR